jgi:hypothetical protein
MRRTINSGDSYIFSVGITVIKIRDNIKMDPFTTLSVSDTILRRWTDELTRTFKSMCYHCIWLKGLRQTASVLGENRNGYIRNTGPVRCHYIRTLWGPGPSSCSSYGDQWRGLLDGLMTLHGGKLLNNNTHTVWKHRPVHFRHSMCFIHYNFSCCFVWVWNVVSHSEGGTKTEGVRE